VIRPGYTFGDTEVAARRLELVADVFDAASRAFLVEAVPAPPDVALDLGCGPGRSTRLVAEATGARQCIGLDTSAAFLALARARRSAGGQPGLEFVEHDATVLPLPGAPAQLVYCRLLLAHLPAVETTIAAWATQLTPGGRLALDEVEWIDAPHPALRRYEEMVVGLVASRGGPMYAGPAIAALAGDDRWGPRSSEVRVVPVPLPTAARMYAMNLATWGGDPWVRSEYGADVVEQLARQLDELAEGTARATVEWGLRQAVFERTS